MSEIAVRSENTAPARPALLITVMGEVEVVELPKGDTLPFTREKLGCRLVDVAELTPNVDMWMDDEGAYSQPVNLVATYLARRFGKVYQAYHGPVLLTANHMGDTVPLAPDTFRALHGTIETFAELVRAEFRRRLARAALQE
ncbi:DUF3846 domain-containing protein [Kitasatospora sp. NPDC059146]|uniref:DUF3846 domain-containing protein n=1 Tax=unclassified Kitasatospora TaxID=2633591 RepID=UPI0036B1B350